MHETLHKTDVADAIRDAALGLQDMAHALGLRLSVWDASGQCCASSNEGCGAFCATIESCKAGRAGCRKAQYDLAQYVLQTGQASRATGTWGCCLVGIPLRNHRRPLGAVVLGFPTREMLDEEHLARLCDRLELDRTVLQSYARQSCRHSAAEAEYLQEVFSLLLTEQQRSSDADHALTSLSMNLANTYEELSLLYHISGSMKVSQEPQPFLQDVCDQLLDVMGVDFVAAVVYDTRTRLGSDIFVRAGRNLLTSDQLRSLAATHLLPKCSDEAGPWIENHFTSSDTSRVERQVQTLIAVPLVIERETIGVLFGINKQDAEFDSYDAKLMTSIASQTSVFLANHRMYAELQELLVGVLQSLTESIDAKDPYTCGHSRRVAEIARRLAQEGGLEPERVHQVYLAGLLHDVGKIGVPEEILRKEGQLTQAEYQVIQRHPGIGAKILRRIRNLEPIIAGVLTHHERIDGKGYPAGLRKEGIPLEGRILCLADSWDAMTSQRTYRRAMSIERAREEIRRCAGSQFDPHLVEILLQWDLETFMVDLHALNVHDLHILDERV